MDNKPLISVVLPVYNVEKYIEKCLDTVVNQSYKKLDIVLVDDGSRDKSVEICERYAQKDDRIRILHKENGGLSDARNYGTKYAKGKYITYIDSDDFVDFDYVEYLYSLIDKYGTDVALATHRVLFDNGEIINYGNGMEEVLDDKKCLERMLYHDVIDTSAWGKMYNIKIFANVCYPKGKLYEDIGTTYKTFLISKKIACGYCPKYTYNVRQGSIVTGTFSEKKFDLIEMTDNMARDVLKIYPDLDLAVRRRQVYARFSTLNQMLDVKGYKEKRNEFIKYILDNKDAIVKNHMAQKRDKVAWILLKMGYPIYRFAWKIRKRA